MCNLCLKTFSFSSLFLPTVPRTPLPFFFKVIVSYHIAAAGLEFTTLLFLPLKCWDYRPELPTIPGSESLRSTDTSYFFFFLEVTETLRSVLGCEGNWGPVFSMWAGWLSLLPQDVVSWRVSQVVQSLALSPCLMFLQLSVSHMFGSQSDWHFLNCWCLQLLCSSPRPSPTIFSVGFLGLGDIYVENLSEWKFLICVPLNICWMKKICDTHLHQVVFSRA